MAEWWTYRPSDFLMFSPAIYGRLFESVNEAFWPAPWLLPVLGLFGLATLAGRFARGRPAPSAAAPRVLFAALAAAWALAGWAFLWQRFAPIQPAAAGFALAFGVQALGLAVLAGSRSFDLAPAPARRRVGAGLAAWALAGHPLLAGLRGQPWAQAEVAGLAPDPTALLTLGALLLLRPRGVSATWGWRALWVLPLAWCVVGTATLATLGWPQAWVVAAGAVAALVALAAPALADALRRLRHRRAGVRSG